MKLFHGRLLGESELFQMVVTILQVLVAFLLVFLPVSIRKTRTEIIKMVSLQQCIKLADVRTHKSSKWYYLPALISITDISEVRFS